MRTSPIQRDRTSLNSLRSLTLRVGCACAVILPSAASAASARDWYIATDGVDAIGRGSVDQPVRTIQWLLEPFGHHVTRRSDAQPGDVVRYRGGDYPTQQLRISFQTQLSAPKPPT